MVDLVRAGELLSRPDLTAARERHLASRAELPASALRLQRGEVAIPTVFERPETGPRSRIARELPALRPKVRSMHTLAAAGDSIWSDMFTFQIPATEKILRTIFVYTAVALLIRLFGRRILAQLNLSDLVVVLLLSNVVQNAIIGDDNSLSGGLLGALTLVLVDYLFDRVAFMIKGSERFFDGKPITVVEDGQVDSRKLRRLGIRDGELRTVLHRLGADHPSEVEYATLRPGGAFDVALKRDEQDASTGELEAAVRRIELRIDDRFEALEARITSSRE